MAPYSVPNSLHKPTEEDSKVIAFLNAEVGEDILRAEYSRLIAKVNPLDAEKKAALLAVCVSALSGSQSRGNDAVRIAAARVIVALLPLSLGAIADLLNKRLNKHQYEVHFTLFCYLDWAQEMPDASSLTQDVLRLVEKYLMTVPRKTARAAWMAGDMLGEHWNEQEAMPLLVKAAQGAKYSVGRQLSVLGLEEMLDRLPVESASHKHLRKTLRSISSSDPSKYVREDAKEVLSGWRKSLGKSK